MQKRTKQINTIVVLILIIQAAVAIHSSTNKQDQGGLGVALFIFLMAITLIAWPIVISIDRRIYNRTASQNLKPASPKQLKWYKALRVLIIGGVLLAIILALR